MKSLGAASNKAAGVTHYLPTFKLINHRNINIDLSMVDIATAWIEGWNGDEDETTKARDMTLSFIDPEDGTWYATTPHTMVAGSSVVKTFHIEGAPFSFFRIAYTTHDGSNSISAEALIW